MRLAELPGKSRVDHGILVGMLGPLWDAVGEKWLMLLTGTFLRSLDEKQRFAIPKRLRDMLGFPGRTAMFFAPGTDGSLSLYPEQAFSSLAEQLDQGSPNRSDVRAFSRLFYAQAHRIELDRQGRVRIPPELSRFASLSGEIVLLGVRDHLEIWDRNRWEDYLHHNQSHYDEFAETAFADQTHSPRSPTGTDLTEQTGEQKNVDLPARPK